MIVSDWHMTWSCVGLDVTNADINLERTLPMRYAVVWWLEKLRYRLVKVFFLESSMIFPTDVCFIIRANTLIKTNID